VTPVGRGVWAHGEEEAERLIAEGLEARGIVTGQSMKTGEDRPLRTVVLSPSGVALCEVFHIV